MRQATCQLPYPFSRFSPPPRFDCSERSSPPPRSILENKGGNRQGECLSALQRLIKSSDERQRVNWQSRQDLADEKVAAVKREEQKKLHALRRCMRSEQIVRFKGSPFSKAGADNSREGIVKEIVFIRPRHDTKMPDYIAVELLLRRTAAVDTVASSPPPPPAPPPSPKHSGVQRFITSFRSRAVWSLCHLAGRPFQVV